jgi:hypothetical protein
MRFAAQAQESFLGNPMGTNRDDIRLCEKTVDELDRRDSQIDYLLAGSIPEDGSSRVPSPVAASGLATLLKSPALSWITRAERNTEA